ncbi:MAG: hypothetical protein K2O04_02705 [Clostridiales bacterium]|nr:hypothetical protein [Clostridiales bacterium]
MKNPHDQSEYVKLDEPEKMSADGAAENAEQAPADDNAQTPKNEKKKKAKYSGAYYYVDKDEQHLATMSFARTTLTIIALLLQLVVLLFPQAGTAYVSDNVASLGLFYVLFVIFGVGCVWIWLMIMNIVRYKIQKRIVAEHAPKNGFKNRAYFGQELFMASMAIMAAFELSFVCFKFDGWGLGAFFVCLASLGAAVAAREITHRTLKDAELISAPTEQ